MRNLLGLCFDCGHNQRLLELKAQKEILAIWGTTQDRSMEQGNRTRQLGLIHERDWDLEGNLSARIQVPFGGKKHAAGREIQRRGKLKEVLARQLSAADEERDRNGQTIPVTALRD